MSKPETAEVFLANMEDEILELELGERGNPGVTGDNDAQIWARHEVELRMEELDRATQAGYVMGMLEDHGARQTHSTKKMIAAGKEKWMEDSLEVGDWGTDPWFGRAHRRCQERFLGAHVE